MNTTLLIIILLVVNLAWSLFLNMLHRRSMSRKPAPCVSDIYNPEEYEKWRSYQGENNKLALFSTLADFAVTLVLVLSRAFAAFAGLFPQNVYAQLWAVLLLNAVVSTVFELPFSIIHTFRIEEKYGFNRSTVKTFVADQIKGFIITMVIVGALCSLLCWFHQSMGDWVLVLFAGVMVLFGVVLSMLMPVFTRIFNKFTPLEDGELKEKLTGLMSAHGYKVRAIEIMDASRRSSKVNAYFTGMGPTKTIVLYDTLVEATTPEQICAIFAHELGHGLHHDMLKSRLLSILQSSVIAVAAWLIVRTPALFPDQGFSGVNYGMAFLLMTWLLSLINPLMNLIESVVSRKAEYRADAQAVSEGYGEALISGLKVLGKANMADLSPDPLLVKLTYSHPTLEQRIIAIEKQLKK